MKQPKLLVLITLLMSMMNTEAFAAYQVANADGVMIYYNLINGNELEVTYQGDEYHYYPYRYSGNVAIPASVTINGKTYSVTRVGYEAFRECSQLTSVTLPTSVKYISESAFKDCSGLTSIVLPVGLSEGISNYAFQDCTSLTSVIIPDGTTWLGAGAFQNCSSLGTITIPNSVTLIGISALDGTAWYDNQPDGLVYAGKVAYKYKGVWPEDCHLVIGNGTLGIANSAFNYSYNKLTSVVIPGSITYIGTSAFYGCNSLVSVTMRRKTPVNIDSYTFSNRANAILYVPAGSKAAYESATYWKEFKKIVELSPVITFADANVKALCVANWDTDGDEELSEAEAAAVTDLGKVFKGNTAITSFVELKYFTGLTSLSNEAFSGCSNLTSVTIPDNVIILGYKAFYKSGLTSISIPNSVEVFGDYAFYECGSLTTAKIGNGVTDIGRSAFYNCSNLASVSIGTSVTSIGVEAFSGCSNLSAITIPDGMVNIGMLAFYGCSSLISVEIPNSVKTIDLNAFKNCSGLLSIKISNSVKTIGYGTFSDCSSLVSVEIPDGVTTIDTFAFQNCSSLTSLIIPNSVTTIANEAFSGCSGLTSVTIPSSVTSLGVAFTYCSGLTSISVDESNTKYDSRGNCNAIIETASNKLLQGCKNTVIPSNITAIGECAFIGCSGLTAITIPSGVTTIGDYAFNGCSSLTSVTVEMEEPVSITLHTFSNSPNATLYVPAGSKAIYEAVDGWKLFKVIVEMAAPSPVIEFADAKVKALCVANWDTDGDGELDEAEAANVSCLGDVFKGNNSITSFDELSFFTGITTMGSFNGCTELKSITIPESVKIINMETFRNCSKLTDIYIPEGVQFIGTGIAPGCPSLASIKVDANNANYDSRNNCNAIIAKDGNVLLAGCKNTVIPDDVERIASNAFNGGTGLTAIAIPNSVTDIESYAFYGCQSLSSIILSDNLASIGYAAFYGCKATCLTVGDKVISIADFAFYDCDKLTSVTVLLNEPLKITKNTFSNRTNAVLYVPYGCKSIYKAADYWNEFKEIRELPSPNADTDISQLDNVIYINKVEGWPNSELTISVKMKNAAPIRGFQFNLYLPDGVTAVKNSKGRIQATLSNGRRDDDDEHTLTCSEQEDGSILFLCGSQYEENFTGNDGEIFTLTVKVSEDMADGEYPIILENIKLSESDITKYYETSKVKTTLTIMSYTPGDINADGKIDVSDYIGVANRILGHTPEGFVERASDVDNNGVIDVSDYLGIGNIIHTGSVYGSSKTMTKVSLKKGTE